MLGCRQIYTALAEAAVLVGQDDFNGWWNAIETEMRLSAAAFTPSVDTAVGDIVAPTFSGYAPIDSGTPGVWDIDPSTGNIVFTLPPPAGGFRWVTTDADNLPQTIFGYAIFDEGPGLLLATALFDAPIVLTDANQLIVLPPVQIVLPIGVFI